MKKNILLLISALFVCCFAFGQGTIGQYPGAGVGFDAGCGYPSAGNSDPGVSEAIAGNACGSTFNVTLGAWTETAAGFDITGFELNNYDVDQEAAYGIRLFYGPQDNCCTICLDAMLDLGQGAACGTFGPQANLASFGYPIPATYGTDIFGEEIIPYANMCPNTEYFAQYQFISATAVDLTDPDGNFCAMDDALIAAFGTQSTVQTLVAPGTRDPLVINSATVALVGAADCASNDVMLDFTLDVSSGCTVSFGKCSKGFEFEFRAELTCADASALSIGTGDLLMDPTGCYVDGFNLTSPTQISLGSAADVCAIFACDPNASLELYAKHTFCEADDINGDGTGNDEAAFSISIASILADFDAAACCALVCDITPEPASNIVCDDADTPFDPSDDTYTFDILVNGSNTDGAATNTFNDDQGNTGIAYGTTVSYGPFPISGGNITVNFTDADESSCTGMMMATAPATCSPATCTLTPDVATAIVCDDNDTPADPSDDTYTFDILVNGSNTDVGATNTFNDDQGNTGIAYGTTVSYGPFPIAGGPITVTFTDADAPAAVACTGTMMANPPATCSGSTCSIVPDAASAILCGDNDTPFDPSDDIYIFDILVNGSSTFPGATNTFNDDQGNVGIAYGTTVSYGPFPISGGNITVNFTDADEPSCTGMMMATAPATCSPATCTLTPDVATAIVCDDNDTPADPSDDTYTFDILVNGSNTDVGATNTFNDDQGNTGIAYGTTVSYGPFPIAGGPITVTFTDADAPAAVACTGTMMANPPATCSGSTCSIVPDAASAIVCDDNDTPSDPSDDTYTFDILVNGSSTFSGATNTFNDDQGNVGIAYGTTVSYGPFPISGGNVTVNFTDADEPSCTGMMMATAPAPCSGAVCEISVVISNIVCDSGADLEDPADDMISFDYTVTDIGGTGATWSSDQGDAGVAYGTTIPFGPVPADGTTFTITVNDDADVLCTATDSQVLAACPPPSTDIPTLSEWGLITLALLLMAFGSVKMAVGSVALANTSSRNIPVPGGNNFRLPFDSAIFRKSFMITGLLALVGFAICFAMYATVFMSDIIGVAVTGPILAYLGHLLYLLETRK